MPAQRCFRLGPALSGGDRLQPGIEAADTDVDDATEPDHGMVRPLARHKGELAHALPLAKKPPPFAGSGSPPRGVCFRVAAVASPPPRPCAGPAPQPIWRRD